MKEVQTKLKAEVNKLVIQTVEMYCSITFLKIDVHILLLKYF